MSIGEETINRLPSAGESFYTDLRTFLNQEDADRYALQFQDFVQTGGTHGTAGGLVGTPSAMVAFCAGFYVTESGSITYPNNDTTFVIANAAITGNAGTYTRVAGTHYLIDAASATEPVLPAGAVRLMTVTAAGGSIIVVVDRRTRSPFPSSIFVNIESFGASAAASAETNRAAIQAAHDALPSTGGTLLIPNAVYQVDGTTITITKPITIEGQGSPGFAKDAPPGPTIQTTSATANTFLIVTTNGAAVIIRNVCFQSTVTRTGGATILLSAAGGTANQGSLIDHCVFDAPFNGIVASAASNLTIRNCYFQTVRSIAVQCENTAATTTGGYLVEGCTIQSAVGTAVGVRLISGGDLLVIGCIFTGAFNIGVESNIATAVAATGLTVVGCRLSGQTVAISLTRTGSGTLKQITLSSNNIVSITTAISQTAGNNHITITGNYLSTTVAGGSIITLTASSDVVIFGNNIIDASGGAVTAFVVGASCQIITIGPNQIDGFGSGSLFSISGSAIGVLINMVSNPADGIFAADLPTVVQGSMLYCDNCRRTGDSGFAAGTCVGGGSGNLAVRHGTLWKCQATN